MTLHIQISLTLLLLQLSPEARAVTTWKGPVSGYWDVPTNWAGGEPTSNSTVRLDHDRQTNAYTVIVRTAASTDKLWMDSYGAEPVNVQIDPSGHLELYSMRMGFKEDDRASSFTINGGTVRGMEPTDESITNTAFLVGNNPNCIATLTLLNGGELSVLGSNGLIAASSKQSIGRLDVSNGNLLIKDSLLLGQGPQALGELTISGSSSVSITGALHIAKLDQGTLFPTGAVHVAGGTLECGRLNIGAQGIGSFTLSDGHVSVFADGITVGRQNSTAHLKIAGGIMETIGSSMNIGHLDSSGTVLMTNGTLEIDGSIALGSSSRSAGTIEMAGGGVRAENLILGAAASSTGTVHLQSGSVVVDHTVYVGAEGVGILHLGGGALTTTQLILGGGASAECKLTDGELVLLGTGDDSLQISNSVLQVEKALIKWHRPNLSEWVTNAWAAGTIQWSGGRAYGTYSADGFDGCITNSGSLLFWDNQDNGSSFTQSVIWVEESPYNTWTDDFQLEGSNALWSADPDHDGLDNLSEFGLGGNPILGPDPEVLPTFRLLPEAAAAEYIYRMRSDSSTLGLTYHPAYSPSLMTQAWTAVEGPLDEEDSSPEGFISVTNQIPMQTSSLFLRLLIQLN